MSWAKRRLGVSVQATPAVLLPFAIVFCALSLLLGPAAGLLTTLLLFASLLLHEFAHALVALAQGVQVTVFGLGAMGTYIRRRQSESPWVELAISCAGPCANLLLYVLFRQGEGQVCTWLALMNLVLAVSNLLPITGTDGARAFYATRVALSGRP